jgi:hypothetical protein
MQKPYPDSMAANLVPLAWVICFVAALIWIGGSVDTDHNGDGRTTIRDIFILVRAAWFGATIAPVFLFVWAVETHAPEVARFLELDRLAASTGDWFILVGLAAWFVIFCMAMLLEERIHQWRSKRKTN